jgi:gas vesicle protein
MATKDEGVGGGAVMLAFVAGAIAGAAVALLFAPATGEETRDFLNQRAREASDKVVDAARQFRAAAEQHGTPEES